jgi:hypothetical protein
VHLYSIPVQIANGAIYLLFLFIFLTTGRSCVFMRAPFGESSRHGQKKNGENEDIQQRVLVLLLLCTGLPAA